jgi:hypothetical protein
VLEAYLQSIVGFTSIPPAVHGFALLLRELYLCFMVYLKYHDLVSIIMVNVLCLLQMQKMCLQFQNIFKSYRITIAMN